MKLSVKKLREMGACSGGLQRFEQTFGTNSFTVTRRKAIEYMLDHPNRPSDFRWLARAFLSPSKYQAYRDRFYAVGNNFGDINFDEYARNLVRAAIFGEIAEG